MAERSVEMKNENENKSVFGLAEMIGLKDVPKEGVNILRTSGRPFASYPEKTQQRLKALHAQREILRHTSGHCCRCGSSWKGETKQCPKCLKYHENRRKKKRLEKQVILFAENGKKLVPLERRIMSLEIAVARLQLTMQDAYKRGYKAAEQRINKKTESNRRVLRYEVGNEFAKGCQTSAEELRMLNHAFGR